MTVIFFRLPETYLLRINVIFLVILRLKIERFLVGVRACVRQLREFINSVECFLAQTIKFIAVRFGSQGLIRFSLSFFDLNQTFWGIQL